MWLARCCDSDRLIPAFCGAGGVIVGRHILARKLHSVFGAGLNKCGYLTVHVGNGGAWWLEPNRGIGEGFNRLGGSRTGQPRRRRWLSGFEGVGHCRVVGETGNWRRIRRIGKIEVLAIKGGLILAIDGLFVFSPSSSSLLPTYRLQRRDRQRFYHTTHIHITSLTHTNIFKPPFPRQRNPHKPRTASQTLQSSA